MKRLVPPEVSIGNIFEQVEGAIISGPTKIKVGEEFKVTTKINEYRVIVYNWKNEAIFNENVKHGSTPDIKTPVKPEDNNGDYKCDDCGADLGHCSTCICHKGNVL